MRRSKLNNKTNELSGEIVSIEKKKGLFNKRKNNGKTENNLTHKEKKKVEKGISQILRPLKVIKWFAIFLGVANLILPVIQGTIGFKSIWGYLLCIVYYYAVRNSKGLNYEYTIPIGWVLGIRTVQLSLHLFKTFGLINLAFFFVACMGDALFLGLLFYHRSNYVFEVERYVK